MSAGCLDQVGPPRAAHLSGGQRSRALLADEPVASLDPASADAILTSLEALPRQERLAMVISLHQPDLARRFADRILHLSEGRLV